jgi:hypothetical protein
LLPLTGKPLFDQIQAIYNAVGGSDLEKQILKNMQLVAATHALLDELGTNVATITDAGIQSQQTTAMPRVYGWEFKAFQSALQDATADAVDILLQSLWLNKTDLPAWTGDDAYTQFNSLLIRTGIQFSDFHPLFHPQRTFYTIKSLVKQAQDQMITASLGEDLVQWFLDNYDALDDTAKKILKSLQSSLAFYSVKRTCEHYSVRISDAGFSVVGMGDPESQDTAGMTGETLKASGFLMLKIQACDRDGAAYLAKARKELVKYSLDLAAPAEMKTALAAGPLAAYDPTKKRDLGNDRRKGSFRM